ncbi:MAG: hypothetical protein WBP79_11090, partial [Candidatus Acidiferrales bacterium]
TTCLALVALCLFAGTAALAIFWPILWLTGVFAAPASVQRTFPGLFAQRPDLEVSAKPAKIRHS